MTSRVQHLRSVNPGAIPGGSTTGEDEGVLWVNIPDRVLGTFDIAGNPIVLASDVDNAVTKFSSSAGYTVGELVAYNGKIYRYKGSTGASAWNAADWDELGAGDIDCGTYP